MRARVNVRIGRPLKRVMRKEPCALRKAAISGPGARPPQSSAAAAIGASFSSSIARSPLVGFRWSLTTGWSPLTQLPEQRVEIHGTPLCVAAPARSESPTIPLVEPLGYRAVNGCAAREAWGPEPRSASPFGPRATDAVRRLSFGPSGVRIAAPGDSALRWDTSRGDLSCPRSSAALDRSYLFSEAVGTPELAGLSAVVEGGGRGMRLRRPH